MSARPITIGAGSGAREARFARRLVALAEAGLACRAPAARGGARR
jgi:hypothetical protein